MTTNEVPLVVCVSSDVKFREWIVRRLDQRTPVLVCTDLDQLRATLFHETPADGPRIPPLSAAEQAPAADGGGQPADGAEPAPVAALGDLVVDMVGHEVTWRGVTVATTRRERELLARLIRPPISIWPYERLFAEVWGGAYLGDTSILHSAIKRLRRKLAAIEGAPVVETVRGVGYRLAALA